MSKTAKRKAAKRKSTESISAKNLNEFEHLCEDIPLTKAAVAYALAVQYAAHVAFRTSEGIEDGEGDEEEYHHLTERVREKAVAQAVADFYKAHVLGKLKVAD